MIGVLFGILNLVGLYLFWTGVTAEKKILNSIPTPRAHQTKVMQAEHGVWRAHRRTAIGAWFMVADSIYKGWFTSDGISTWVAIVTGMILTVAFASTLDAYYSHKVWKDVVC